MEAIFMLACVIVACLAIAGICWLADRIEAWAKSVRGRRFFETKE